MNGKGGYKLERTPEAATRSDIFVFLWSGKFNFYQRKVNKESATFKKFGFLEPIMFVSFGFALAMAFNLLKLSCNRARSRIINGSTPSYVSFSGCFSNS